MPADEEQSQSLAENGQGLPAEADQVADEARKLSTRKVELDTAGLDLEDLKEVESEPELEMDISKEVEEEFGQEPAPPKKPGWFWPVVLGGCGLVVSVLVGLIGYYTWWAPKPQPVKEQPKVTGSISLPEGPPLVKMPDFIIPLNKPGQAMLQISISLALSSEASKSQLTGQRIKVRNLIYQVLLKEALGELKTTEQKLALRESILSALNRKLEGGPVKEVYFSKFLIL
ncbi:MAG: flagellar basal body-associated FliL family protein [Deltaproteobacteria bacterium]|nr:flagellar basal body-associated FliL family protein [Deltaproteobacteria bacterium]